MQEKSKFEVGDAVVGISPGYAAGIEGYVREIKQVGLSYRYRVLHTKNLDQWLYDDEIELADDFLQWVREVRRDAGLKA